MTTSLPIERHARFPVRMRPARKAGAFLLALAVTKREEEEEEEEEEEDDDDDDDEQQQEAVLKGASPLPPLQRL
ncbi:hypothetical protein [uncultured Bilophila sp.]|uniref:hypothetical protein n=1 Tax=uncultured Bilophila sp. TaxID=529385 RepID=UPI00280AEF73|nr:hypothetical protein [uncultured Bilophila sp.]